MILRAKNKELFQHSGLTEIQRRNQAINSNESESEQIILKSSPRRIVCELTNACNLSCIMCGRNAVEFRPTKFQLEWVAKVVSAFLTFGRDYLNGVGRTHYPSGIY